jgi:hypothetical protein
MRHTHTLTHTHTSGHLFAPILLVFLFILAVGSSLSSKARITSSSVPKCAAVGADTFFSTLHCNQFISAFAKTATAGGPSQQFTGLATAGNDQPLSAQRLFADQYLMGKAVRLDAAVMIRCLVLGPRPAGVKPGKTGQRMLGPAAKAESSVSGIVADKIVDDKVVTTCPQSLNPQSKLSQCYLRGTLSNSVSSLSARVFLIDSQVLKVSGAQALSPTQLLSDSGEIRCELHTS